MSNKTNLRFVQFLPEQEPDNNRLCYVYSNTIAKADAVIMQYDADARTFFYLNGDGWLEDEDFEGLFWGHIALPSEYKDKRIF